MDNDDMMLNIVTSNPVRAGSKAKSSEDNESNKKMTKTDVKRMKYSMKMKYNSNKFSKGKAKEQGPFKSLGVEEKIENNEL